MNLIDFLCLLKTPNGRLTNDKSAFLIDRHPSLKLVDLPGAFTATNRTIQKVANIAIALHALRQISDLISRSAKSDPVIHATSTQSTSVQPSLYDRKSTVIKTAFNATSAEEFSTARNLDHIQRPCKMLIESIWFCRWKVRSTRRIRSRQVQGSRIPSVESSAAAQPPQNTSLITVPWITGRLMHPIRLLHNTSTCN